MGSILLDHQSFDREEALIGCSEVLRGASERLASQLPDRPAVLLARTDAALMCCAGASLLRKWPTEVRRAHIGRSGWAAPAGAVLVEAVAPLPGLLAMLRSQTPDVELVVLDGDFARTAAAA
jgi:hypothetical protein